MRFAVNDSTSVLAFALIAARRGWRVAPARRGRKHPYLTAWQREASADLSTVAGWFVGHPERNLCIATGPESGIWVLDVDDKQGGAGSAALAALERQYGPLPCTYSVGTGSGGVHYYWAHPDFQVKNTAGALGPGLDTRGGRGQVVAPPSRADDPTHIGPYVVLRDIPPVPAPPWLLTLVRDLLDDRKPVVPAQRSAPVEGSGRYAQPDQCVVPGGGYTAVAIEAELERIRAAPDKEGNNTLASAVYNIATLAAADWSEVTPEQAYAAIVAEVDGWYFRCDADRRRMQVTINSQFRYGMARPRKDSINRDPLRSPLAGKGL